MKIRTGLVLGLSLGMLSSGALAQSNDAAAERARIANQRIAAEAARRTSADVASESAIGSENDGVVENPDNADAAPSVAPVSGPTVSSTRVSSGAAASVAPSVTAAEPREARIDMSQGPSASEVVEPAGPQTSSSSDVSGMLDELERLGQMRDAGYVTDAEFERIKLRILDGNL